MRKWQSRSQLSPDDEFMCPPLPGQVPVEPTVTSTGPTAQGAVEASPANRSSTGEIEIRLGGVKCTDRDFAASSF